MSISINLHGTASIHAYASHSHRADDTPCQWLTLTFVQKSPPGHYVPDYTLTVFLDDATLVDRLVAAVNGAATPTALPPSPTALDPADYRE